MPLVLTEMEGRPAVNSSYFSSINPADGQCLQEKYSDKFSDCSFGLLGNLYACEGKPGKVIGGRVLFTIKGTVIIGFTFPLIMNLCLWLYINLNTIICKAKRKINHQTLKYLLRF